METHAFDIFVKHTSLHMNAFDAEDVSTLKCVSSEIKKELDVMYHSDEKQHEMWQKSLTNLGYVSHSSSKKQSDDISTDKEKEYIPLNALNGKLYIQHACRLHRLYGSDNADKKAKFVAFMKDITLTHTKNMFISFNDLTLTQQSRTICELLNLGSSKYIEIRILVTYLTYYFLNKLIKHNSSVYLKNRNKCVLSNSNFRFTVISKANQHVTSLKNEITSYPYTFTEKVIRMLNDTKRLVSEL